MTLTCKKKQKEVHDIYRGTANMLLLPSAWNNYTYTYSDKNILNNKPLKYPKNHKTHTTNQSNNEALAQKQLYCPDVYYTFIK